MRLYRKARRLYLTNNFILIRFANLLTRYNNRIHNSFIPHTAKIGNNTTFAYGGIGVVIHKESVIGDNCMLGQGITIGGRVDGGGVPKIGNNVYIGAGARILGGITIGDFVVIGVNAVVIKDVPDNCVIAGVPARIIRTNVDKFKGKII